MGDRPPPKGRGAAILARLKKKEEQKTVGVEVEENVLEEPPKPRGRAALLLKLQERLKKVGTQPTAVETSEPEIESKSRPSSSDDVEDIRKSIAEVSFVEREPVTYRGENGKPLKVSANYIKLHVQQDRGVYEYEVKFHPDLDAKNKRIKLVNTVMREMSSAKVFDGGNVLYLPKKITDTSQTFSATLPGPDGDQELGLTIIFKRKKSFAERECLHLYNVLFKRIMHTLLYTQMGRNYFDTEHRYLIPQHKLEVLPGFAVTVDEQEDGLLLCLDTAHRVLRTQNAYELLNELRCADPRRFKEMATSSLIGSCIFTRYNNRTYTVDDIAWDMNPEDTFPTRDGRNISFLTYYREQYNIVIQDPGQPLLINRKDIKKSGSAEKVERMVCLIPELSYLTGMTDQMRNDFRVMKDVAHYTRVTPNQRMSALRKYLDNIKNSEKAQAVLNEWGLTIGGGTIDLHARQLDNETIFFGNSQVHTNNNADWNRAVGENKVTGPIDMFNWIVFFTERDQKNAREFAQLMVRLGPVMGCDIKQPKPIKLADDRTETYMRACREHIDQSSVQIVVFICPTMRSDRYSVIKRICCTEIPVASQVINSRTLSNPQKVRSIVQKIALQMTCKLGGTLWTVRFPFKGWMICGIDVYHGGPGNTSVCGFVASLNESVSRWFSVAISQDKELGDYLKFPFTKALEMWRNENGVFPAKIVMIRDGVGDGQLDHCKKYEVEQLESVLREFELETKLCFVVVQKRINTRIFSQVRDGYENPSPGTVVDYGITRRYLQDFFLVPQNVRQGTVNPTHYIVLHDMCGLKPDHIQRLCYKLCHLYYNWPGTIRVPAPCQYAHKLAALVGQFIKKEPSAKLADKLFYL